MKKILGHLLWAAVSILAALCLGAIALNRNEHINSFWLVVAATCTYLVGFRFYAKFLSAKVMGLDDKRATPAERLRDGHDFEPTNKWIVFGHHFAAIAGPGPLVGPTLAAQFGYLPGTLWIIIGAVLGGAVEDFVLQLAYMRLDGKALVQMAREEIWKVGGFTALLTVLLIMIILLAVVALVVVNALKDSPWGAFTIAATMPIALFMGLYLRFWRPGKVLECSVIGFALVLLSIFGGQWVSHSESIAPIFRLSAVALAFCVIAYGFLASALPVWLLLAPRDYLSTFVKLGVVMMLGIGILFVRPELQMPAYTRFTDGTGPIFAGKIFPFCFITIACGAISGFHALISSGTTPKMIDKETHARMIGYGAMLCEGFVGIMAFIAVLSLSPSDYFAINVPPDQFKTLGMQVEHLPDLSRQVGEDVAGRTGGAVSLAVGMAYIFSNIPGLRGLMAYWYHFAIMFEALFILTTIDTGTRVARFLVQECLGRFQQKMEKADWAPGAVIASFLVVGAWGYFIHTGTIGTIWPMFG